MVLNDTCKHVKLMGHFCTVCGDCAELCRVFNPVVIGFLLFLQFKTFEVYFPFLGTFCISIKLVASNVDSSCLEIHLLRPWIMNLLRCNYWDVQLRLWCWQKLLYEVIIMTWKGKKCFWELAWSLGQPYTQISVPVNTVAGIVLCCSSHGYSEVSMICTLFLLHISYHH